MSNKKPVPPSLAQFALEQLADAGEQAAIDLTVQNVEILRAEIVKRDARIESQARMIERIESERAEQWRIRRDAVADIDTKSAIIAELRAELAALKAQQSSGVVLPEREAVIRKAVGTCNRIPGSTTWNAAEYAYDEFVARLNPCRAQAVPDGWRVMMCTASVTRLGDRWEVYLPGGSGGVVSELDVKDQTVWMLLDALAAAPSAQHKESE